MLLIQLYVNSKLFDFVMQSVVTEDAFKYTPCFYRSSAYPLGKCRTLLYNRKKKKQ